MLVVADSSPLIALVNIKHTDVLPQLFGQVVIPPQIAAELRQINRSQVVRQFAALAPEWLKVQSPMRIENIARLHEGEVTATASEELEL